MEWVAIAFSNHRAVFLKLRGIVNQFFFKVALKESETHSPRDISGGHPMGGHRPAELLWGSRAHAHDAHLQPR